jgi:tyrosinase
MANQGKMNRREAISVVGAAGFGALALAHAAPHAAEAATADDGCSPLDPGQPLRQRKNIDALPANELANFKHAIDVLQRNNPAQFNSYAFQVGIHGNFCDHASEQIWPWHRAFLYYFEKLLQAADPSNPTTPTKDVTIPYWDWTRMPTGQHGYPKAFEETGSPLMDPDDSRNDWAGTTPPLIDLGTMLDEPAWPVFGGSALCSGQAFRKGLLEAGPHDLGHGEYVGGNMADVSISVRDPIFWAHHANLDRLWDLWQKQHKVAPTCMDVMLAGWANITLPIPAVVRNFICVEKQLGYQYVLAPQTIEFALAGAQDANDTSPLTVQFGFPKGHPSKIGILFQGVMVPKKSSYAVHVYLTLAGKPVNLNDPEKAKEALAGTIIVWPIGHGHAEQPGHPMKNDVYVDITRRFAALVNQVPSGEEGKPTNDLVASLVFYGYSSGKPAGEKRRTKKRVPFGREELRFDRASIVIGDPPAPAAAPPGH